MASLDWDNLVVQKYILQSQCIWHLAWYKIGDLWWEWPHKRGGLTILDWFGLVCLWMFIVTFSNLSVTWRSILLEMDSLYSSNERTGKPPVFCMCRGNITTCASFRTRISSNRSCRQMPMTFATRPLLEFPVKCIFFTLFFHSKLYLSKFWKNFIPLPYWCFHWNIRPPRLFFFVFFVFYIHVCVSLLISMVYCFWLDSYWCIM